jgi:hypothetical protein
MAKQPTRKPTTGSKSNKSGGGVTPGVSEIVESCEDDDVPMGEEPEEEGVQDDVTGVDADPEEEGEVLVDLDMRTLPRDGRRLNVGQVIYMLPKKDEHIVPGLVVEETLVKTLRGTSSSWKIGIGPRGKMKIIDIKDIEAEIYLSIEEAQKVMMGRFTAWIEKISVKAAKLTRAWYHHTQPVKPEPKAPDPYDIPQEHVGAAGMKPTRQVSEDPKEAFRRHVMAMMSPGTDEEPYGP